MTESFAETAASRMGCCYVWGSMDSTYWDEDTSWKRMFDGIFAESKIAFSLLPNMHWKRWPSIMVAVEDPIITLKPTTCSVIHRLS